LAAGACAAGAAAAGFGAWAAALDTSIATPANATSKSF
jgi:hypothetical protein